MVGETRLCVKVRVPSDDADRSRIDVDLAFDRGLTIVMGPSGAGKTTLLNTIAGLVTPAIGRIVLDENVLLDSDKRVFVPPHRRRIALVFQSLALFPHLRAWENVAYGSSTARGGASTLRKQRALTWLDRARVAHVAERLPSSLSGGEAQRVAIARALASEPHALLLDEPFSALDGSLRHELGELLVQNSSVPAILVTHHREDASRLGSRVLRLEAGRVVEDTIGPVGT